MEAAQLLRFAAGCLLLVALAGSLEFFREREDVRSFATLASSALLSWSNSNDDGAGVNGGYQHGMTRTVWSCDPDDPACNFDVSRKGYMDGKWQTNKVRYVQVRRSCSLECPNCTCWPYRSCFCIG